MLFDDCPEIWMTKDRREAIWRSMDKRKLGDFAIKPGWEV